MTSQYTIGVTLTKDEAEVLRFILNRIGGDTCSSARRHADSIALKLDSFGVASVDLPTQYDRGIFFSVPAPTCPHCKQEIKP